MQGIRRRGAVTALSILLLVAFLGVSYALDEDLEITGDVRLRLRYVDSPDPGVLRGTYGEILNKGFSLKHRFVLEATYPLRDDVRVGGMIRVSNEDKTVLEAGPEYLSSEFGSAFIAYETTTLRSRLGYYSTSYTPLTLMRWDTKDDPEGGGCQCPGTPGVAGTILGGTLEELGPSLTFEGLRITLAPGETFGFDGFFARPRTAGDDYQIITFGGKASLTRYLRRTSSFLDLGVTAVRSEEDENSLGGDHPAGTPFRNTVYGVTWKAPLFRSLSLDGEWTLAKSSGDADRQGTRQGKGGIVSLNLNPYTPVKIEASYIYISPNWDSYFRALSYSTVSFSRDGSSRYYPGRQGMRMRMELSHRRILVTLFAKYLKTIQPMPDVPHHKGGYPTLSLRAYFKPTPTLNVGLATIYSADGIEEGTMDLAADNKRTTLLGTLSFEFAKDATLNVEERYVWSRFNNRSQSDHDHNVSMLSLYVRAGIW